MNVPKSILRVLLGRRLPQVDGEIEVAGAEDVVSIRRDRWGIPHIKAAGDRDAWYGVGFCHGQDRSFQLETLYRLVHGTLAELVGKDGVALDRLSRRVGFSRRMDRHFDRLAPDVQAVFEAYAAGVTDGSAAGLPKKAHEFAMLMSRPTPWKGTDIVGVYRLQSFLFATNADAELARLRILVSDGPEVLSALDPSIEGMVPDAVVAEEEEEVLDRLSEDLAAFASVIAPGGGSNSWAVSAKRTSTGRPIVADDPHFPPLLPSALYLVHLMTPEWSAAGGTLVGGPALIAGHNGFVSWGVTSALIDNTDVFQEEVGPDGASVRGADGWEPCEVVRETIKVKLGRTVTEDVLITPRGPIVGPALDSHMGALSLRVFWLDDLPVEGFIGCYRATNFDEFRRPFASWPSPALNVSYADKEGTIGWFLIGAVPIRRKGWGTIPLPGWDPDVGWEPEPVPFEKMPYVVDPEEGFVATANTKPDLDVEDPYLGVDWVDGYRLWRIQELLRERDDWDVPATQKMQLDQKSGPWREMRDIVLAVPVQDSDAALAHRLLSEWDGVVSADSAAATVFEFFVSEMAHRVAKAKAPNSAEWVLGMGFAQLLPSTSFSFRRVGHLVKLLKTSPAGWFDRPWQEEIADALGSVIRKLKERFGEDPSGWSWGKARPLRLRHPFGEKKPLDQAFDIGPITVGGDSDTIAQVSSEPLDPLRHPAFIAGLRMVVDVGNWEASRFVLPSGQSGNPLSPHYADQLPLWERGDGVPIAWGEDEVEKACVARLKLVPKAKPG